MAAQPGEKSVRRALQVAARLVRDIEVHAWIMEAETRSAILQEVSNVLRRADDGQTGFILEEQEPGTYRPITSDLTCPIPPPLCTKDCGIRLQIGTFTEGHFTLTNIAQGIVDHIIPKISDSPEAWSRYGRSLMADTAGLLYQLGERLPCPD